MPLCILSNFFTILKDLMSIRFTVLSEEAVVRSVPSGENVTL